jgi:hypothetical protein
VQARRDEAYTDKGAKKTAKGSVFKVAADRVRDAREEKERLQKVVVDSEGAEKLLQALNEKRAKRQEALALATENAERLNRLAIQATDLVAAQEQIRLAREQVMRIQKTGRDVDEAEQQAKELLKSEDEAKGGLAAAQNSKVEADSVLKSAEENARAEGSDTSETVVRQQFELRLAAAQQAINNSQQRINAAVETRKLVDAASTAEREHR